MLPEVYQQGARFRELVQPKTPGVLTRRSIFAIHLALEIAIKKCRSSNPCRNRVGMSCPSSNIWGCLMEVGVNLHSILFFNFFYKKTEWEGRVRFSR